MANVPQIPELPRKWGPNALALLAHAKVLSGVKLEQLVRRLRRQTGGSREQCWRLVIQYEIKAEVKYRRWSNDKFEQERELLTTYSVEEVAKKLNRSPKALRKLIPFLVVVLFLQGIRF